MWRIRCDLGCIAHSKVLMIYWNLMVHIEFYPIFKPNVGGACIWDFERQINDN